MSAGGRHPPQPARAASASRASRCRSHSLWAETRACVRRFAASGRGWPGRAPAACVRAASRRSPRSAGVGARSRRAPFRRPETGGPSRCGRAGTRSPCRRRQPLPVEGDGGDADRARVSEPTESDAPRGPRQVDRLPRTDAGHLNLADRAVEADPHRRSPLHAQPARGQPRGRRRQLQPRPLRAPRDPSRPSRDGGRPPRPRVAFRPGPDAWAGACRPRAAPPGSSCRPRRGARSRRDRPRSVAAAPAAARSLRRRARRSARRKRRRRALRCRPRRWRPAPMATRAFSVPPS